MDLNTIATDTRTRMTEIDTEVERLRRLRADANEQIGTLLEEKRGLQRVMTATSPRPPRKSRAAANGD